MISYISHNRIIFTGKNNKIIDRDKTNPIDFSNTNNLKSYNLKHFPLWSTSKADILFLSQTNKTSFNPINKVKTKDVSFASNIKSTVGSVGIVKTKFVEFNEKIKLECGLELKPITVAYETYGKLNKTKDNTILILHALTGDAHAAGYHSRNDKKPGWWDTMIGPGKAFDTDKYFVVCSNVLGGCKGTTGPSSINPETGKHYALDFPVITIEDMVNVQKKLIDHLNIKSLKSVVGGSMGGMQALQWAASYPKMLESVTVIASTSKLSAQGIALNKLQRDAIMLDPNWKKGNYYYGKDYPEKGLALARQIGHITYLSSKSMHDKFGRNPQTKEGFNYSLIPQTPDFQVESYLNHQGKSIVERFDPNSYLFITKALDYFDISKKYGSLEEAFRNTKAKFLVTSISSDWLFPPQESQEIVEALKKAGKEVTHNNINSPFGHDAFLLENDKQTAIISKFLIEI